MRRARLAAAYLAGAVAVCGICWFLFLTLWPAGQVDDDIQNEPAPDPAPSASPDRPHHPGWYSTDRPERFASIEVLIHQVNSIQYKVRVTYSLTLEVNDLIAQEIAQGYWSSSEVLVSDLLGEVWVYPGSFDQPAAWDYSAPQLVIDPQAGKAVVTITSDPPEGATAALPNSTTVIVEHVPVWAILAPSGWPPITSTSVKVTSSGFSVIGIRGRATARDRRSVVIEEDPRSGEVRIALGQDRYAPFGNVHSLLEEGHRPALDRRRGDSPDSGDETNLGPLSLAIPWIAVAFVSRRRGRQLERDLTDVGYRVSALAAGLAAAWAVHEASTLTVAMFFILALAVGAPGIQLLRKNSGGRRIDDVASIVLGSTLVAWAGWITYDADPLSGFETSALTVALLGLVAAGALAGLRKSHPAVGFAIFVVCCATVVEFFEPADYAPVLVSAGAVGVFSALLMRPLLVHAVAGPDPQRRKVLFSAATALALSAIPIYAYFDPLLPLSFLVLSEWALLTAECCAIASVAVLVAILRSRGSSSRAVVEPGVVAAGLGLLALPTALTPARFPELAETPWDLLSIVLLIVGALLLMPAKLARRAQALANVSRQAHALLMAGDLHRVLLLKGARGLYRTTQTNLANGEADVGDFDRSRRALERAERAAQNRSGLNSGGGFTPWQNAVAAATYSAITTLSFLIGYTIWVDFSNGLDVIPGGANVFDALELDSVSSSSPIVDLLYALIGGCRWVVYGFFFGFFYTRLQGNGPMVKSALFGLAIAVPEIVLRISTPYVDNGGPSPWPTFGTLAMFTISLGALWERRLALAADIPWARVRRLDSFRSLRTGLSGVVIAILTAAGVALAEQILSSAMKK